MNLVQYQEAAIKTIKYRGTEGLDCEHMIIGMFSELNELWDAIESGDPINIMEEIGDFCWYLFNYATLRKIVVSIDTNMQSNGYQKLVRESSILADLVKKLAIYNKEIDRVLETRKVQILTNIVANYVYNDPTTGEVLRVDIYRAMERNIDKLHKKRYKNAVYTDEAAVNRDLDAERKALEGNG